MDTELSKSLQRLDDFLLSQAVGDDAMLLSELDGFLAGLIICPTLIKPSEWLPLIWGEDAPLFDSDDQAQAVIGLIMTHYNDTVRALDLDGYRPIYDVDIDDSTVWQLWIDGFWQAARLRPDDWLLLFGTDDEDLQRAVFILGRLNELAPTSSADLEPMDIDEELEDLAPDLIPYAVQTLHATGRAQANRTAKPATASHRKVGRNDPCPCGSGKKFKRCCLNR